MKRIDLHLLGPLVALVGLFILGALLNPAFLAPANLSNVLARSAFIGLIAVGMTFVITQGGLDLSVGSMAAFLAGVTIMAMNALVPVIGAHWGTVVLGMAVALVGGVVAGAVNGTLITRARIEAFIVTLGTMGIFRSLVTWLADGGTLSLDSGLRALYRPVYFGGIGWITWPIIIFAIVAVLGEWTMRHTRFGRHVEAIGSNDRVARYSGIDVNRVRLLTYVGLGMLVGLGMFLWGQKYLHGHAEPPPIRGGAVVADRTPGDVRDDVADGGHGQLGGLSVEGQGEGAHAISFRRACSSSRIRPAAQGASRIP